MSELLTRLFECTVCSGVLFGVYAVLLDRRVPFCWCRAYLLAAVGCTFLIPLLQIPVWPAPALVADPFAVPATSGGGVTATVPAGNRWADALRLLGLAGSLVVLVPALCQILLLRRLRRHGRAVRMEAGYTLVYTSDHIGACSFFRTIYVWQGTPADELSVILLHETSHLRHHHSAECLVMEAAKALMWWNPFLWLLADRLHEVEEFEADSDVLRGGCGLQRYEQLILKQTLGYGPDIANGLRTSKTKKRFMMMTNNKTTHRHGLLRLAGVLPALAGLLCAFSFTTRAAVSADPAVSAGSAGPAVSTVGTVGTQEPEGEKVMPRYHDGDLENFVLWAMKVVRFPKEMIEQGVDAKVVASFTIDKDGTLGNIEILSSPNELLSAEVRRVLESSDRWTPGMEDGKPVAVRFVLPFAFKTTGDDDPATVAGKE